MESGPFHPPAASSSPASPTPLHTTCRPRTPHPPPCAYPSELQLQEPVSLLLEASCTPPGPTPHTPPSYPEVRRPSETPSSDHDHLSIDPDRERPAQYTSKAAPIHALSSR